MIRFWHRMFSVDCWLLIADCQLLTTAAPRTQVHADWRHTNRWSGPTQAPTYNNNITIGSLDSRTYSYLLVGTCLPRVLRPYNVQFQPTPRRDSSTHIGNGFSTILNIPIWKILDARNASQTTLYRCHIKLRGVQRGSRYGPVLVTCVFHENEGEVTKELSVVYIYKCNLF